MLSTDLLTSNPSTEHQPIARKIIAGGVGVLLLTSACSIGGGEGANPTSTRPEATTTTLPEGAMIIDESGDQDPYNPDRSTISITPQKLGYNMETAVREPDVKYEKVDGGEISGVSIYAPLAEVTLTDGKLLLQDESPLGMDEQTKEWLGARLTARKELIHEALESGSLNKVVFALDDDSYDTSDYPRQIGYVDGHYTAKDKALVFEISTKTPYLDASFIEQYLTHESVHSLLADSPISVFSSETADPALAAEFRSACSSLREQAFNDIAGKLWRVQTYVQRTAEGHGDLGMKTRYEALAEALKDNEWFKLQPTSENPMVFDTSKIPECDTAHLGAMASELAKVHGYVEPADNWDELQSEDSGHAYDDAQSELDDLFRHTSLYQYITEATYTPAMKMIGHPHDGLDEAGASSVNIMLSFPQEFAGYIKYLPETEKSAIITVLRLVVDQIVENHPNMQGYLSSAEADFLDAVRQ